MRREVLVAIVLGVALGIAVAFGIWRANLALSPKNSPSPVLNTNATPGPAENSDLIITQPENNSVVSTETVMLKGAATPKATVVILTSEDESILEAENDGSFEEEVLVAGGPNDIVVKAYDANGNESEQKITIVYSTELNSEE